MSLTSFRRKDKKKNLEANKFQEEDEDLNLGDFLFKHEEDKIKGTFKTSNFWKGDPNKDTVNSYKLQHAIEKRESKNMSQKAVLDLLEDVNDMLGAIAKNPEIGWLYPDFRPVYFAEKSLEMGEPFPAFVLDKEYLDWPEEERVLPVLFSKISESSNDPVITSRMENPKQYLQITSTERMAYSLSPNIFGSVINEPKKGKTENQDRESFLVLIKMESFKAAASYYANCFDHKSILLNAMASIVVNSTEETMVVRFTVPTIVHPDYQPKMKEESMTLGVKLKLTLYGREYMSYYYI